MRRVADLSRDLQGARAWAALLIVLATTNGVHECEAQPIPTQASTTIESASSQPTTSFSEDQRLLHWRQVFFWSVVLLLIFFIAAWVIIRFSLRYRAYIFREKPPPTPSEDVWRMHRLPEDDEGKME